MHAPFRFSTFASVLVATLVSSAATAQSVALYGGAETTGDNTSLFLVGGTLAPSGLGWKPYVGASAYELHLPSKDRTAFVPRVGLVNVMPDQSVSFGVGYAFTNTDANTPVLLIPGESADGVVGSFGWNYWDNNTKAAQYLASYNFGSNFLWTRLRGERPLANQSPLWVGADVALMGNTQSTASNPSSWLGRVGPMAEWRFNNRFQAGVNAGLQWGLSNASGSTWYAGVEFTFLPTQKR